jgi:hypothetical protein
MGFAAHLRIKMASVQQLLSHGGVALPFVIPSAAEGSAVQRTFAGNVFRPSVQTSSWSRTHLIVERCQRQPILVLSIGIVDSRAGLLQLCLAKLDHGT